jgi:hypothetical protein
MLPNNPGYLANFRGSVDGSVQIFYYKPNQKKMEIFSGGTIQRGTIYPS